MPVMDQHEGDGWMAYHGDCVEVMADLPTNSVDHMIYSPPFASLYTYSDDDRDMGNVRDADEFGRHFGFAVEEMVRILAEGRIMAVHCMNLTTSITRDGVIGMRDFRGDIIRLMQGKGLVYHSEVTIWKDPVTAMQRTKALGLLYRQLKKDSAMSRQSIPDYLCIFRKPGANAKPVAKTPEGFPVSDWQQYASPVWMDIDQGDTLQYRSAREHDDERHICPLQLEVIRRSIRLWSNPGDVVFSPFMGIGSEGFCAVELGRKFVGAELKPSYYRQAVANLGTAGKQTSMFGA